MSADSARQTLDLLNSAMRDATRSGSSCPHVWDEVEQLAMTLAMQARVVSGQARYKSTLIVDEAAATVTD